MTHEALSLDLCFVEISNKAVDGDGKARLGATDKTITKAISWLEDLSRE